MYSVIPPTSIGSSLSVTSKQSAARPSTSTVCAVWSESPSLLRAAAMIFWGPRSTGITVTSTTPVSPGGSSSRFQSTRCERSSYQPAWLARTNFRPGGNWAASSTERAVAVPALIIDSTQVAGRCR